MRATVSDRLTRRFAACATGLLLILPLKVAAQESATPPPPPEAAAPPGGSVIASEVQLSRDAATLSLELAGDHKLELGLKDGDVVLNGDDIGHYNRGDELWSSWRQLLTDAMDTPNADLAGLLTQWSPPSADEGVGRQLDVALESALQGKEGTPIRAADTVAGSPDAKVLRLQSRIDELESLVQELEDQPSPTVRVSRDRGFDLRSPFRHLWAGVAGIFSTLAMYVVLLAMGFAAVFFGRPYLEAVADTARHYTMRSWAVGLAGSFLALPVWILGIVGLAVSIVGIPLLLAWVPLFPVAVVLAAIFGYLAVAHAGGEALAERRLQGSDWFSRGNSFYYLMTGLGLLLAVFLAAHVVQMAGPWLGFIRGLLMFIGGVLTWAALTIGFGAVLLSRAGTRPLTQRGVLESEEVPLFEEEPRV